MSSFHLGEEEALYRQRRAGARRWGSVPPFWVDNLRVGLPDTFHLGLLLGPELKKNRTLLTIVK